MKPGMLIGGYAAGLTFIWVAAYLLGQVLPDRWMHEWYGFPTFLTTLAMLPTSVVAGMYLGDRCSGDEESK